MISALVVGAADGREISLRSAILGATNFDAHVTVIRSGNDAAQVLRSLRFEIIIIDLRGGDEAAASVLEFLRAERPEDLERVLLISGIERSSSLQGQARMLEGDEVELGMPALGRSIARMMGDVVPEMRVWTA